MSHPLVRVGFVLAFIMLIGLALFFRLPHLGERPMHGDEANQAMKTGILMDTGLYQYDPFEHHGPTLYYMALPLLRLSGARNFEETTEAAFRLLPVLFGVGLLLLLWPLRQGLGYGAVLWAALFAAISHGLVYYSRYYVQEMLFVFFLFAVIVFGWRYARSGKTGWAVLCGAFAGLAQASKETSVIAFAAMAMALALTMGPAWWRGEGRAHLRPGPLAAGIAAALAVCIVFYSSFFTHWRGLLDAILTYTTYLRRADGTGSTGIHDKPWYYYLQILVYFYRTAGPRWSEGLIVGLSGIGALSALFRRSPKDEVTAGPDPRLHRFLAWYTLFLLAAFSVVPYKTPWNMLVFLHGMTLLAGLGAAWLMRIAKYRPAQAAVAALLLACAALQAQQTRLGTGVYAADVRNPYVYAHTSTALLRLVNRVDEIAAMTPENREVHINILRPDGDYWPLPWYLRQYKRVGYWTQLPERPDATMIIADTALRPWLEENLKNKYHIEFFSLRPNVLLFLYIRQDLWDAFIASRSG